MGCGCDNKTCDIRYSGDKLVCANNTPMTIFRCDTLDDVIEKLFNATCGLQQTAFAFTNTPYATGATYPAPGGTSSLTIPADGTYFITGGCTITMLTLADINAGILVGGVVITNHEKTMTNGSASTISMDVSFIYRGTFAQGDVIQIGVKDNGPSVAVTRSEIYYQKVGG